MGNGRRLGDIKWKWHGRQRVEKVCPVVPTKKWIEGGEGGEIGTWVRTNIIHKSS